MGKAVAGRAVLEAGFGWAAVSTPPLQLSPVWKLRLDLFNVFNAKGHAAEYFYTDRLRGEPASGVADIHRHPLEPRSLRLTLTATL